MVGRLLNFLNREIVGLHKAAFLLGFFALSSQLLALVRDRLLAGTFGAGVELDIYYAAFRIPDFIFITIASLVSASVVVPFLVERLNAGRPAGRQFINQVFSFFTLIIFSVAAVTFMLVPTLLEWLFAEFKGEDFEQLVLLTRLLLLSPILMGFSGLFGSISQAYKRFFLYALSPVFYNLGIIAGIFFLAPVYGIIGVGLGVVAGALLHLMIHLPFARRQDLLPRFDLSFQKGVIKRLAITALPRTFTLAITHIILFVLIILAAGMRSGSISVFQFAFNLQSVPLSIIGVSYSLAAFPTLSGLFTQGRFRQFGEHVSVSARHIVFWSVPVIVLFVVLRAQIVRVILGTGEFDWVATHLTAATLALFSVSVMFQGLVLLLVRSFYAMGRTVIPLVVNVVAAVLAIGSAVSLVNWFEHSESFRELVKFWLRLERIDNGAEVVLLAFGYSIGIFINAVMLALIFQVRVGRFFRPVLETLFKVSLAALGGGAVTYIILHVYSSHFVLATTLSVFGQGLLAGLAGLLFMVLILMYLNSREIWAVWATARKKFWKTRVVGPDSNLL